MSTTVYIPQDILSALDQKAKKLKVSRNKLIINACKKEVIQEWPEELLKKKIKPNKALIHAADEMLQIIKSGRHNKGALDL